MQVLSVELAALDIKMRNTILKRVLVPLQISIKPVFLLYKRHCRKKKQILVHMSKLAGRPCWRPVPQPRA